MAAVCHFGDIPYFRSVSCGVALIVYCNGEYIFLHGDDAAIRNAVGDTALLNIMFWKS